MHDDFRRWLIRIAIAVVLCSGSLAFWRMNVGSPDERIGWSTTIPGVVTVAGSAVALLGWLRGRLAAPAALQEVQALADDLASTVREQWTEESLARGLTGPAGPLPLHWRIRGAERDRGDVTTLTAGSRRSLDGPSVRVSGRFQDIATQLARQFQLLPVSRAIIVGEPGSGKTVLAVLLALGLLGDRNPGSAVPVVLSAWSWDPSQENLKDWIVRTLADSYYGGRTEIPRRLLNRDLIFPLLDGIDEIPEASRRLAVRAVNYSFDRERGLIITCRSAEYAEYIAEGAPTLWRAPVVEVMPLSSDDVVQYLQLYEWPEGTTWETVTATLHTPAGAALKAALSTPLMVSFARTVYQSRGGDPAELLDAARFDSRASVEEYLTDQFVDAAYARRQLPSGHWVGGLHAWQNASTRKWLTFLARYTNDAGYRDLRWWRLGPDLLPTWFTTTVAAAVGAAFGLLTVPFWLITSSDGDIGAVVLIEAVLYGLLVMMMWSTFAGRVPGRVLVTLSRSRSRLRRGYLTGLRLSILPGVLVVLLTIVGFSLSSTGWTPADVIVVAEASACTFLLANVVGLAMAVHQWLNAPPSDSLRGSPRESLVHDRQFTLVASASAGAVVALLVIAALVLGMVSGELAGYILTAWPGSPGEANYGDLVLQVVFSVLTPWTPTKLVGLVVLPAVAFAVLVALSHPWARYLLVRVFLTARRQLPWKMHLSCPLFPATALNLLFRWTGSTASY